METRLLSRISVYPNAEKVEDAAGPRELGKSRCLPKPRVVAAKKYR
jgi:hypothetical protein